MNDIMQSAKKLLEKYEESFVELGQLLSEIKHRKLYRLKGYEKFRDFIEGECEFDSSKASRLVMVYDLFITEMDMSESDAKSLGYEKMSIICPLFKKLTYAEKQAWIDRADMLPIPDLKAEVKEARKKDKPLDAKKVYVEQHMGYAMELFNCTKSDLMFKLALLIAGSDKDTLKKNIKRLQTEFENSLTET